MSMDLAGFLDRLELFGVVPLPPVFLYIIIKLNDLGRRVKRIFILLELDGPHPANRCAGDGDGRCLNLL
jgi:hypothetical protein